MGNRISMILGNRFRIRVTTGDLKGAGTDANVYLALYDDQGIKSGDLKLDKAFCNDLERGRTDEYTSPKINEDFGVVTEIELWRDNFGVYAPWYCEVIQVTDCKTGEIIPFPVQRWIKKDVRYKIPVKHTSLPQDEKYPETRKQELIEKKEMYQLEQKFPGFVAQVKTVPEDELYSDDYKHDLLRLNAEFLLKSKLSKFQLKRNWQKLEDLNKLYNSKVLPKPKGLKYFRDDLWFGAQRLAGCSPTRITLCTEIPDNFQVTDDLVEDFLEGNTIAEACDNKKLFIVDHKILEGLPVVSEEIELPVPMALFYLNTKNELLPIAIQLRQEPGPENPVFLPSDPDNLWLIAKMWFNLADAQVQGAVTHQGRTHGLMEGVYVTAQRNLALNHPVFRLLAPHFHYILAINLRGLQLLLTPDGVIQKTYQIGLEGFLQLVDRGHEEYHLNVEGYLPEDLKTRGLDCPKVLPDYPYRDDALPIYSAIKSYVSTILQHYYDSPERVQNDEELQAWCKELVTPRPDGVGLKGVPNDGQLQTVDDLIMIITSFIFTSTVQHALTLLQYAQSGFQPNYPSKLLGTLPKTKEHEPTDQELVALLPDMETTVESMLLTRIISDECAEKLGYWKTQCQFDDVALEAEETFRARLKEISKLILQQNEERSDILKFDAFYPSRIPNSVSL